MNDIVNVKEAAQRLGVTVQRVCVLLRAGRLRGQKHSGVWLIQRRDLEAFAQKERKPGRPRVSFETDRNSYQKYEE